MGVSYFASLKVATLCPARTCVADEAAIRGCVVNVKITWLMTNEASVCVK